MPRTNPKDRRTPELTQATPTKAVTDNPDCLPSTSSGANAQSLNKRQRRRKRYQTNLHQKKDQYWLKNEVDDQYLHRLKKRVLYLNRKLTRKYREAKAVYKDTTINKVEQHEIFKSKFLDAKFTARYALRAHLVQQKYQNKEPLEVGQVSDEQIQEYMNKVLFN